MSPFDLHAYANSDGSTHVMVEDDEHFAMPPGSRVQLSAGPMGTVTFTLYRVDPDSGQDVVMDRWWRAFGD